MPNKRYVLISYILVYIIWSTTYLAVKLGVHSIPVFLFVGLRWFFSGLFLLALALIIYKKNVFKGITRKQVMNSVIAGFSIIFLNNLLFSESMKTLDSYFAAIVMATSPLFLTIFDYFINKITFTKNTLIAIFLGIFGIGILLYKGSLNLKPEFHIITLILGLVFFGFGSALSHRLELPKNSVVNSSIQMLFTGLICFLLFILTRGNLLSEVYKFSLFSLLALVYLIIFGAIGMMAYIYLIKHEPLSRVGTYAFVNPIGATILGVIIGEKLNSNFFIASPLILIALVILLRSRVKMPHMESEAER